MNGDLHTHTFRSDGSNPPIRNFELARNSGLSYIAITDHDYLPSSNEYKDCEIKTGVKAIHGVELSCRDHDRGRRVHILCYLPHDIAAIQSICNKTNKNRIDAGTEMAELVAKKYPITVEDVQKTAADSSSIFKQHIMQTLMNAGFATEMFGELWSELFSFSHGSCVRNCKSPDVWDVVNSVHMAGGVAVLAHPFTYDSIEIMKEMLSKKLLDGIEVYSSKTNAQQEKILLDAAVSNNLIVTGGSDFHGANGSIIAPIGAGTTAESEIEKIFDISEKNK